MQDSTSELYNFFKTLTSMFGALATHVLILFKAYFPLARVKTWNSGPVHYAVLLGPWSGRCWSLGHPP
jgi:hypothetical protein